MDANIDLLYSDEYATGMVIQVGGSYHYCQPGWVKKFLVINLLMGFQKFPNYR